MNYDIALYINGEQIPESLIAGEIIITRNENESALMDFTLITGPGVQNINQYTGKTVRLDVIADSGSYRLFTGKVDYPDIDLINKRMNLQCSTNRKELIETVDISMIGYWSEALFNKPNNKYDELEQRLKTTPETVDFDAENNYTVNSIEPKAVPDFTLQNDDILYRRPTVAVVSTSEIINNVNLNFDFRYPRLRHRERWFRIGNFSFCDVVTGQAEYIDVNRLLQNVENTGWAVNPDNIGLDPLPPSGWYSCLGAGSFAWQASADQDNWALGVDYTAAYRFAQTIVEKYNLTIKAPQSQSQYGVKTENMTHSLDYDFNADDWEKNDAYASPDGLIYDDKDYYKNEEGKEFNNASLTALNIAKTTILRSHRKNRVNFDTLLFPTLELRHTVKIDSDEVVATGKVTGIEHRLDISNRFGSTLINIEFSTAEGSQVGDTISIPDRLPVPVVGDDFDDPIIIEGVDSDIITPAIDDLSRNTQTVNGSVNYDIEIPNSPLTVTF